MALPSEVRVVNRALVLLGTAQRVTSLSGSSPLEQAAADVFEDCRDLVMAEHPWNFAISRALLPQAAGPEAASAINGSQEWDAAYELPGDLLRWLPWRTGAPEYRPATREGRFLLSIGIDPLAIRYIARMSDASRWSPGFVEALAGHLAMMLAGAAPVQQQASAQRAERIYEGALSRGKRMDALESGERDRGQMEQSNWVAARGRAFAG